ncbi:MAG: AbrB/MazE/SpoVT family DNA-binding domain-containing protein [Oscillospiraceae bacterium]|jgi:transcriptional pleiotropic regulator of transition state genes|nr:AbrB/MazE/SpoVT family DNA-binding domain-containing protein [Oscillospiraceae bacterium]
MKSIGIVRRVDELGRIVLPIELRKILDIESKDPLEIFVDGNTIMLRKYEPECTFCGDASDVKSIKGKNICSNCIKSIGELISKESNSQADGSMNIQGNDFLKNSDF